MSAPTPKSYWVTAAACWPLPARPGPPSKARRSINGQRAAPGAIERVRIDPETLEPRFRVIGCELVVGRGRVSKRAVRETGITGDLWIRDYRGDCQHVSGRYRAAGRRHQRRNGCADGAASGPTGRTFSYLLHGGEPEVLISQADIRAIQLAKAALHAGARLLMDRMGVDRVDRIRLAGAFGSQIDVKYAMVLGMIPDCELEKVSSAANAAGTGARIALLNRASRDEIERRVRQIEKIETAVDEGFQQHFVDAMGIPHGTRDYPCLSQVVSLPEAKIIDKGRDGHRRRRSRRGPDPL